MKAHGGTIFLAVPSIHHVTAYVPLTRIKELASEEGVIKIFPDVRISLMDLRPERATPIPTAAIAATVDVSQKIEPELLALVELEEQQPGQGRQQAGKDLVIDTEGRIGVIVDLDPNVIVVEHSGNVGKPVGQQEASLLLISHGVFIVHEMGVSNQIGGYVPFDRIRALAREEAVTHIWLDRYIYLDEPPPEPLPAGSPEGVLPDNPNEHIETDPRGRRLCVGRRTGTIRPDPGWLCVS